MNCKGFGIEDDYQITVNAINASGVYKRNDNSFIITTSNGIFTIQNQLILENYPIKFSVSTEIREYNLIVGLSSIGNELFILSKNDLQHTLLSHFQTGQTSVSHLIHIPNSRLLVSVGNPTQAWRINYYNYSISLSYIGSIEESFDVFAFDSKSETIFYKKDSTMFEASFINKAIQCFSCYGFSLFDFCSSSGQFILFRNSNLVLMNRDGNQIGAIDIPKVVFSILKFINQNFVIATDKFNDSIYIFDVKLLKLVTIFYLKKKIDNLFIMKSTIAISSGPLIFFKKLKLPYRFWAKTNTCPILIKRCNKKRKAARIMILSKDNTVSFFSPKTKEVISSADIKGASSVFYDRGMYLDYLNDGRIKFIDTHLTDDRLFVQSTETGITVFDTSSENCLLVNSINMNSFAIISCEYHDQWAYCIANLDGELVFVSMIGYMEIDRIYLNSKRIIDLHYHHRTHSIYAVYTNEINRYDFKARRIVESIAVESNSIVKIHGDFLVVGFRNGTIQPFIIHEFQTFPVNLKSKNFHNNSVTGLSFSTKFFVSSSRDCSLKYWNYSFSLIDEILLPFPILTCELLNGKRHVLVGVDNAILYVDGGLVFGDEADIFEAQIDSFDLLDDDLTSKSVIKYSINDENEEEEELIEINEIIVQNQVPYLTEVPKAIVEEQSFVSKEQRKIEPVIEIRPPVEQKKTSRKKKKIIKNTKTPRRLQEREKEIEKEKLTEREKEKEKEVLSTRKTPRLPAYNPSPRNLRPISSLNKPRAPEQPKMSWNEMNILQAKAQQHSFQTHVFDFNADELFANNNNYISRPNGPTNSSFAPKKKLTSQTSVKIRRIQKM